MTVPTEDPAVVPALYRELEAIGYDSAWSFEARHDPFLPLAVASQHTQRLRLGTAIAIAFARTPMVLANLGWDLQTITGGRFVLGLGSQIRQHVVERFGMPWSRPAARMAELVRAVRAIWSSWEDGTPLDFRGEFYRHTRMIPAFDPGPNRFGRPPIFTAGVGPHMTEVAGEVADGFFVHPVNTRRSLQELTLPALDAGLARSGRTRHDLEVVCVTIVVTGRDEEELTRSREAVRQQLAFYGTTPAYRPVFDLHDRGELHPLLVGMARDGRWDEMAALIDDDFLETVAVVGEPDAVAGLVRARLAGISDSVSLVNNRAPDPRHLAEVVAGLHAG
ncbi:MAG: TIGR03617 family F420-dependent LLM class oxidoreductase [Acidimicrobiales bacterium]|jgi:probable F420-dependent oxidoreductase|nr:TIGR03617 family F420-dependent LLM class oxidoreductase [Acidimicrobiales bacterium]